MLKVTNLKKAIDNQTILDDVSFTLQEEISSDYSEETVRETTLLRTMVGILDPDEGMCYI